MLAVFDPAHVDRALIETLTLREANRRVERGEALEPAHLAALDNDLTRRLLRECPEALG